MKNETQNTIKSIFRFFKIELFDYEEFDYKEYTIDLELLKNPIHIKDEYTFFSINLNDDSRIDIPMRLFNDFIKHLNLNELQYTLE